jgi:hypothetical protein
MKKRTYVCGPDIDKDVQWIATLLHKDMLQKSYVPVKQIRVPAPLKLREDEHKGDAMKTNARYIKIPV